MGRSLCKCRRAACGPRAVFCHPLH